METDHLCSSRNVSSSSSNGVKALKKLTITTYGDPLGTGGASPIAKEVFEYSPPQQQHQHDESERTSLLTFSQLNEGLLSALSGASPSSQAQQQEPASISSQLTNANEIQYDAVQESSARSIPKEIPVDQLQQDVKDVDADVEEAISEFGTIPQLGAVSAAAAGQFFLLKPKVVPQPR